MITCKAAVIWQAGELPSVEEVEVAPPRSHEVRVKVIDLTQNDVTFFFVLIVNEYLVEGVKSI